MSWLLIIIFGIVIYFLLYNFHWKRLGLPPGPTPLPIIGNLLQLGDKPHLTLSEWGRKYGQLFTFWIANKPVIAVTSYSTMKEMLVKQGDKFTARPKSFVIEHMTLGKHGIVATDGDLWKEQRRFSMHVLRDLGFGKNVMESKVLVEVRNLVEELFLEIGGGKKPIVDMEKHLQLCVVNIISSVVLGRTFRKGDPKLEKVAKMAAGNFEVIVKPEVVFMDAYNWLRYLPIFGNFGFKRLQKQTAEIWGFLGEELEEIKQSLDEDEEPTSFATAYLKEMRRRESSKLLDESYFSERQLLATLGDLFIAGFETTVTTLRWALLYMITYPEIQEKAQEEILNVVGSENEITMAYKNKMPYTAALLNEVQRISSIVPSVQHAVSDECTINGYTLPKGTCILPHLAGAHSDPEAFPDPENFDPMRFLEDNGKTIKKVDQLVPFSMGKRVCLGESLARMELFLIFATLLQKFQFSIPPESDPPSLEPIVRLTLTPQPYKCLVAQRQYGRNSSLNSLSSSFEQL